MSNLSPMRAAFDRWYLDHFRKEHGLDSSPISELDVTLYTAFLAGYGAGAEAVMKGGETGK
jgi:hypothetical protein